MKNKIIDPFLYNVPSIDLHGDDREIARVKIIDFIKDNLKLKNEKILIIHGIGTGTLKNMTHELLKSHKYVIKYQTMYFNQGSTVVWLKIDK